MKYPYRRSFSRTLFASFSLCVLAGMAPWPVLGAVPMGSEFDTTMTPAAGGMIGVATVRPQDPIAAIFANPATLTQSGSNAFAVGLTYGNLDLRADSQGQDVLGLGQPFKGSSELRDIALPHFAAVHRFTDRLVGGMGITAISGLGADFRSTPGLPGGGIVSDLKLFGGAFTAAYEVSPSLSVGGSVIVGIGMFQAGLFQDSASVNGYGIGGQFGATYDAGAVAIGGSYRTEIEQNYDDMVEVSPNVFRGFKLQQPQQTNIGIATTDAFSKNTLLAFEWRYKNYDSATGYQDFWKDQHSFSFGLQQTLPAPVIKEIQLRFGYRYATDLAEDASNLGNHIGSIESLNVPGFGAVPLNPTLIQLFQVTAANGYWAQAVSVGAGFNLTKTLRTDLYAAYAFDGKEIVGPFRAKEHFFHLGFGLSWAFD